MSSRRRQIDKGNYFFKGGVQDSNRFIHKDYGSIGDNAEVLNVGDPAGFFPTSILTLLDSKILFVSGLLNSRSVLYNPITKSSVLTCLIDLDGFTSRSALLPDGRVLIIGSTTRRYAVYNSINDTVIYTPEIGNFSADCAITLPCGLVYLNSFGVDKNGRLYDSVSNTFRELGYYLPISYMYMPTVLPNGEIFSTPYSHAAPYVFNPLTGEGRFLPTDPAVYNVGSLFDFVGSTLLADGNVLINPYGMLYGIIVNPITGVSWRTPNLIAISQYSWSSQTLPSSEVFLTPYWDVSPQIYNYKTNSVRTAFNLAWEKNRCYGSVAGKDGRIYSWSDKNPIVYGLEPAVNLPLARSHNINNLSSNYN